MHDSIPLARRDGRWGQRVHEVKPCRTVPELDGSVNVPRHNELQCAVRRLLLHDCTTTSQRPPNATGRRFLADPRKGHERPPRAVVVHAGARYLAKGRGQTEQPSGAFLLSALPQVTNHAAGRVHSSRLS
jgi:hypothetical protein